MGANQQFSLRWNNYLHHITDAFDSLREDENLVDVTLCCEGRKIKAHKMLLSACSSYFRDIFKDNPCQHPVIVFHNVRYDDLVALVSFMYRGEVNVEQEGLSSFLNTAELLEVQGLTSGPGRTDEVDEEPIQESKSNRKQSSPKPYQRPESPVLKRRKVPPTEEGSSKDPLSPVASVKLEPDFYGGEAHDEPDDHKPQSLSQPSQSERSFENSFSDENMDGASEMGAPGASSNDVAANIHESLQASTSSTPALHTCAECGKTFRHSGSLSMHKRLHIGDTYCVFCGRVFSRKYYLKLHMKMHHYQAQPPPLPYEAPKSE